MVVIQLIPDIDEATLKRLIVGYTTQTMYQVSTEAQPDYFRFELRLIPLEEPRVKRYAHLDADTLRQYREMVATGHSFGAFANELCVGLALSELQTWNRSLCLQELHVAPEFRRQGIGRLLVERLSIHARAQGSAASSVRPKPRMSQRFSFTWPWAFAWRGLISRSTPMKISNRAKWQFL